jgi:hypothetical protein
MSLPSSGLKSKLNELRMFPVSCYIFLSLHFKMETAFSERSADFQRASRKYEYMPGEKKSSNIIKPCVTLRIFVHIRVCNMTLFRKNEF